MPDFSLLGKGLFFLGWVLVLVGGIFWATGKAPFLGRLPGDIRIEGEHFHFYFPLTTCLLISSVVSLLFWMVSKFK